MRRKYFAFHIAAVCAVLLAASTGSSEAASFRKLASQGYAPGTLIRSASGGYGWIVSNGKDRYFCKMKATLAYVSRTKMVSFTAAGRQIELDRKTFERSMGGKTGRIPNLADLKAGRLHPDDVGSCRRVE